MKPRVLKEDRIWWAEVSPFDHRPSYRPRVGWATWERAYAYAYQYAVKQRLGIPRPPTRPDLTPWA